MHSKTPHGTGDDGIRESLAALVEATGTSLEAPDRQFRSRVAAPGLTPEQRTALTAVTPGALLRGVQRGESVAALLKQAAGAARELAMSGVNRNLVLGGIREYTAILREALQKTSREDHRELRASLTHVQNSLRLVVHEAWASVCRQELDLLCAILRAESAAEDESSLAREVLQVIVSHFGAAGGAWFHQDGSWLTSVVTESTTQPIPAAHSALARTLRNRPRVLRPDDEFESPSILVPEWRGAGGCVWSLPAGPAVVQLRFTNTRTILQQEQRILRMTGGRIAGALAQLEREAKLRNMSVRMLEVEELERRRIARELHDDAGQSLVVARLQLELVEMSMPESASEARQSISEVREITEKTILGVRRLISDLSPAVLEQLGLGAAIRQLANRFRAAYPATVRLHLAKLPRMDPKLELVIYRVLQECFSNISRHSHARRVNVWLTPTDRTLRLTVEDDGTGFRVEEGLGRRNCFGLLGIRERVSLIGGKFQVESNLKSGDKASAESPSGTKVVIEFPVKGEFPNSVHV